ncbi:MAG: Modification methylase DpnIIB [Mycoplasmataceae bacterium]|nr:MAG: Modification methylase DpnIIB [Mycoplasmataceae bacterium]
MTSLNDQITPLVFFDPQYDPVSKVCWNKKTPLAYQTEQEINQFMQEIERILEPNGYLCLWVNKWVLLEYRIQNWLKNVDKLKVVDVLAWNKDKLGMGARFRNQLEFLVLLQKFPYKVNFPDRRITNLWTEKINQKKHPHQKPLQLLKRLISTLTQESDLIIDPCAGSFVSLTACQALNRNFLGCDLTITKLQEFYEKNYNKTNF